MSEAFEFTDRYQALGIPYPDPETVCDGECEGTGTVPVCNREHVTGSVYPAEREEDPDLLALWNAAHQKSHSLRDRLRIAWQFKDLKWIWQGRECDGWHFVRCPQCDGTGRKEGR